MESKYKTVLFPISVPKGDYCWNREEGVICGHFGNEGGHPDCSFNRFIGLKYDEKHNVKKCDGCLELEEKI